MHLRTLLAFVAIVTGALSAFRRALHRAPVENIDQIDVKPGKTLSIKLINGTKVEGTFATMDYRGAVCGQQFAGYEHYGPAEPKPFYIGLDRIRAIRFVHRKGDVPRLLGQ